MKNLLTTCLLFVMITNLNAQQKIAFGPSAGMGVSILNYKRGPYTGLGYKIGVSSKIKLNRTFFLCPEVYLSRKGFAKFNFNFTELHPVPNNDYSLALHYVDFCLPVKIKVVNTFYIQTGVQAGYLINATYPGYSDINDYLQDWDFGFIGGFNWDMENGLGFSILVNAGFFDVNTGKIDEIQAEPYYYNDYSNVEFGKNVLLTGGIHYLFGKTKGRIIF